MNTEPVNDGAHIQENAKYLCSFLRMAAATFPFHNERSRRSQRETLPLCHLATLYNGPVLS